MFCVSLQFAMPGPLSLERRWEIVGLRCGGTPVPTIARHMHVSGTTVWAVMKQHRETMSVVPRKSTGRTRKSAVRQDRVLKNMCVGITSGVGVTKPISSVPLFPNFAESSKHTSAIAYHVYIWQVSPQLSCGDTCQIWMRLKWSNRYFGKVENSAYGEINERSFSNPHPWSASSLGNEWRDTRNPVSWGMVNRRLL